MKFNKIIRWILVITYTIVCLLGVSYASYTDNLSVVQNITTSRMEYSFSVDGDMLNIKLGPEVSNQLLNLNKGESYLLVYTLSQDYSSGNVKLKNIDHEYIGCITINLNYVSCTQNEMPIDSSYLSNYIPNSLGTFDCYHDFNGIDGSITLVKTSESFQTICSVESSELPDEIHQQIDMNLSMEQQGDQKPEEPSLQEENVTDGEEVDEIVSEEKSIEENAKIENINKVIAVEENMNDEIITDEDVNTTKDQEKESQKSDNKGSKIKIKKSKRVIASVKIEATYGFNIPLNYDQFNYEN